MLRLPLWERNSMLYYCYTDVLDPQIWMCCLIPSTLAEFDQYQHHQYRHQTQHYTLQHHLINLIGKLGQMIHSSVTRIPY